MRTKTEIREMNNAFRLVYQIFPDGDIYEKLSVTERVIEWVLGE